MWSVEGENEIEVNPCVAPSRAYSAEEWVAHSLINTAARFLLRPLASFLLYIHL